MRLAYPARSMVLMVVLCLSWTATLAETKPKASAAQTEEWLNQHIVAWDDSTRLKVETKDCRMQVTSKTQDRLINFKGTLFPIEIIAKGSSDDAFVRIRVKDRYTGNYGMQRSCSSNNQWCRENENKWSYLSYQDFRITHVRDYVTNSKGQNVDKATQLKSALEHYSKLCNAKAYNFRF